MASLTYHDLSSLLLITFTIFYTSINGYPLQSSNQTCPSFDCGNGLKMGYPFWDQSHQLHDHLHCGYPNFNISCNDQKNPIFHMSNESSNFSSYYQIKNINYFTKSLTLSYPDSLFDRPNCSKFTNFNFQPSSKLLSSFNYTIGNKMLHFYYNCTLYPPSLQDITCLAYNNERSFVFVEGSVPEFDWHKYCESVGRVPVSEEAVIALNGHDQLVNGYGHALQGGFRLTWSQPLGDGCVSCESSGGFCGYGNGRSDHSGFFCTCGDGQRDSLNCNHQVRSSNLNSGNNTTSIALVDNKIHSDTKYAAIGGGLIIIGGLVIGATIFYVVRRREIVSYKPVGSIKK